ncbi:MAG: NAD+ synthase [Acidobacteria bacterium]|nr:NAD+ synthase [Acidobacteriota bacterium]
MKVAIAQFNALIGDFNGTLKALSERVARARAAGAELVVFPELAVSGYPAKDLLERHGFIDRNLEALRALAAEARGIAVVAGFISRNESGSGKPFFNSAAFMADGEVTHVTHKCLLPTYDVFDEARHFESAPRALGLVDFGGVPLGITICEDLWNDPDLFPHSLYRYDPVRDLVSRGARLILNLSASPFSLGKPERRRRIAAHAAWKYRVPVVLANQVGGHDDIVFDGHGFAVDAEGRVLAQCGGFIDDLVVADTEKPAVGPDPGFPGEAEQVYRALVLGTRDYVRKCGFRKVVLGLSGGIDSALTACVAAEALGAENVLGVAMPSRFNAPASLTDAADLARNLGIRLESLPIGPVYEAFLGQLAPVFAGTPFGGAEENLQARIRGTLLMAISNKQGAMVLSTGNKSELAVGYCTLYGDMCGGLAVISDLFKTRVYEVSRWVNREREIIPRSTLEKAPSAELRPDQTDQDDLPPYDLLDRVLELYVEERRSVAEIAAQGIDETLVRRVARMVDANEYKRRQAAPGIKVTEKAFGAGRRLPLAQGFTG